MKKLFILLAIFFFAVNIAGLFITPAADFAENGVPEYDYPVVGLNDFWQFFEKEPPPTIDL